MLQKYYLYDLFFNFFDWFKGDATKVELLKGLAHAETRLKLFEADIYNPTDFEDAIQGCSFVFHLAMPMLHYSNSSKVTNLNFFFYVNLTY